jgi:predicted  nucleic acid-binding Zn-ribbon protein
LKLLQSKEEEQKDRYLKRKQELRQYHDGVMELEKKLRLKSEILSKKEHEIQQWEESHLFKDLRSEMTRLQQQKEQWLKEQSEKEAQWRARIELEREATHATITTMENELSRREENIKKGKLSGYDLGVKQLMYQKLYLNG